jgi:hypothetical protein
MPTINIDYLNYCITNPQRIKEAAMWGAIWSGVDFLQGARVTPGSVATSCGFIWAYHALQCPLEAIHGRRSLYHNCIAAGTLGALGVHAGKVSVPFVDYSIFHRHPALRPWQVGFVVYGSIGGVFGALGGKQF